LKNPKDTITLEIDIPNTSAAEEDQPGALPMSEEIVFLRGIADPDCTDCGGSGAFWLTPPGELRREVLCWCVRENHKKLVEAMKR
jgi:hypothetical protein